MRAAAPTLRCANRGPHLPTPKPPPLRGRPLTQGALPQTRSDARQANGIADGVRSAFRRKTDLTPVPFRYLTDVSTKVDTYQQPQGSVRGGAVGWVGHAVDPSMGLDVAIHGANGRAHPPRRHPADARCCCCRCRCVEQVQGATLPNNPNPRPGNPRWASAHRSARDAACPSASAAPATVHPPACPATGPAGCAPASAGPTAGR